MKTLFTICLMLLLVFPSGCGKDQSDLKDSGESEKYEVVDKSELAFSINDFYYDGVVSSEGTKPIRGEVGKFTCEGHVLELESKQFEDGFIVTKDYGKIKIRFSSSLSGGSFSVWLTPSQKKALAISFPKLFLPSD